MTTQTQTQNGNGGGSRTSIAIARDKDTLRGLLDGDGFKASLRDVANKYMTPERVVKVAMLAASREPKLFQCTTGSLLQAIIKGAEAGLEFGGSTGQGYLVPYKNGDLSRAAGRDIYEAQFIPGYQGFIELAYRSGRVTSVDAQLVYENDECDYSLGSDPFVKHRPNMSPQGRGKLVFAYCVVFLVGSDRPKIEIMPLADLERIRSRSKSKTGPWLTDTAEMQRKTVLRRAFKWVPKTPDIIAAIEADNADYDLGGAVAIESGAPAGQIGTTGCKDRMRKALAANVADPGSDDGSDPTRTNGGGTPSTTESRPGAEASTEQAGRPADDGVDYSQVAWWSCSNGHEFGQPEFVRNEPQCPECHCTELTAIA